MDHARALFALSQALNSTSTQTSVRIPSARSSSVLSATIVEFSDVTNASPSTYMTGQIGASSIQPAELMAVPSVKLI